MRVKAIAFQGLKRPKDDPIGDIIITDWNQEILIEVKPENGRYTSVIFTMEQWQEIIKKFS